MPGLKRAVCAAAFVAAASMAALTTQAIAKDSVKIGICVSWPGYAMHEIARQKDLAPDYDIELVIFDDPLGGHAALAAGQIDIYECTGDYTPLAIDRGTGVVNVAFANPSYGVDHIILAPGIDPSTISGKRIAAPQAYIGQLLMGVWLDSKGVSLKDVDWVNLNADEAVGPMISGDLAAAYLYEPWISKVMENLPGSSSAVHTGDPAMLKTGIFMDTVYMNGDFIKNRREAATAMLKARWHALGWWHENTKEGNEILAKFLKWPLEDVQYVIGTNGKFLDGGIYMYDFDEAAQVCGVLEGEPPFELGNGAMPRVVKAVNEWWVRLDLMKTVHEPDAGIDCSLMADLLKSGYRQSFGPNE